MKKLLPHLLICLLLSGCMTYPRYYDDTQTVSITTAGANLTIDGYKAGRQENNLTNGRNVFDFTVDRSISSLTGRMSKPGFKDKLITITSHVTEDKWATERDLSPYADSTPKETCAWHMAPLSNAFGMMSAGAIYGGIIGWVPGIAFGAAGGLAAGLVIDAYNLVIGIPSVIIANPWYEYDKKIDLSGVVLTPTPEFEQACHAKPNSLIANNACHSCEDTIALYTSQAECDRCPKRVLLGDGRCVVPTCPKGYFQDISGACFSCNDKRSITNTERSKCLVACPNREWKRYEDGACRLKSR